MAITLNLPPDTEQMLLAEAKAHGISLDVYLQTIITTQAVSAEAIEPLQNLPREAEEADRCIDAIFDAVRIPPGSGQGAMRRENWYR